MRHPSLFSRMRWAQVLRTLRPVPGRYRIPVRGAPLVAGSDRRRRKRGDRYLWSSLLSPRNAIDPPPIKKTVSGLSCCWPMRSSSEAYVCPVESRPHSVTSYSSSQFLKSSHSGSCDVRWSPLVSRYVQSSSTTSSTPYLVACSEFVAVDVDVTEGAGSMTEPVRPNRSRACGSTTSLGEVARRLRNKR